MMGFKLSACPSDVMATLHGVFKLCQLRSEFVDRSPQRPPEEQLDDARITYRSKAVRI